MRFLPQLKLWGSTLIFMSLNIVFEDKYIIVVEKPTGIPSQPDKTKNISLFEMVENYANENNNTEIGIIHRLDRPVGGIMVFSKGKNITAKMSEMIKDNLFEKTYLSVVCGQTKEQGHLKDYIMKNQRLNLSKIVNSGNIGAKLAELDYKTIACKEDINNNKLSLVEINLITGRHHQIRVQFANNKTPIWGDTKYNQLFIRKRNLGYIALWAYKIKFKHPKNNQTMEFELKPSNIYPFDLFNL